MQKSKLQNWSTKKLGEVACIIGGYAFKSGNLVNSRESNDYFPVIKIGNLQGNGNLNVNDVQYHKLNIGLSKILIKQNDILVAMTGATVGKVAVSDSDNLLLNQRVGLIRATDNIADQKYLKSVLFSKNFYNYCQKTAGGGAQDNISPSQIMNYRVLLPPLSIQHQIVDHLDAIKKAQELNDKQIALADELFQSLLNRELGPKGTDRKMNKLEEVTEIIMGQSPPSSTYNAEGNGLPFLQGKFEFGEIYPIPIKFCSQPLRIAKKKDVLLSVRAPVGPVNLAPSECCIGRGLSAIRAKAEKLDQLFLFYFMKLNEERMSLLGCGSTFNAIGRDHIEKIKISLPPLEAQRQIVAKLQAVHDYKRGLLDRKQKLQELFESCLDKAMKGELVN